MAFIYYKCELHSDVFTTLLEKGIDITLLEEQLQENCPYKNYNDRSIVMWNTIRLLNHAKQTLENFTHKHQLGTIYLTDIHTVYDPNSCSGLIVFLTLTNDKGWYERRTNN